MRRLFCLLIALMISMTLVTPALAADEFVSSITYKGAPEIVEVLDDQGKPAIGVVRDADGKVVDYIYGDCLLITPVSKAKTSTKIPAEAKETLLYVYEKLSDGSMKLPYGDDVDAEKMVIRELVDASWLCGGENSDHSHPEMVAPKKVTFDIIFDLGISRNTQLVVMTYKNDEWNEIVQVKNNKDGTTTCTFEDLCPVAFAVPEKSATDYNPKTGDAMGENLAIWVGVMLACAAGVVVMVSRKKQR